MRPVFSEYRAPHMKVKRLESLRPKIRINNEDREYFQSCIIFVLTCDQGSAFFGTVIFLKLRVFFFFFLKIMW